MTGWRHLRARQMLLRRLVDCSGWALALSAATFLRYDFHWVMPSAARFAALLAVVAVGQLVSGQLLGLYTGRWRLGSLEEARAVASSVAAVGVTAPLLDLFVGHPVPLSATLIATPIAFTAMAAPRSGLLLVVRRRRAARVSGVAGASRVIVFGAGDGGARAVAAMKRNPSHGYLPVALLDDNRSRQRLRIHGVDVGGDRFALQEVAQATRADTLLIAIPSADAELVRDLHDRAAATGLRVRVLPTVQELLDGGVRVEDIRPVSYADLLGRREVTIDVATIAGYLTGKRVLVTGAGGSIGAELCRQVVRFDPEALVMLDRDESALHSVQLSIHRRALLDTRDVVVADIRDRERLAAVFAEYRPQVVFHAAALKHLPLLEMYPDEAVKTNVWGTWNVLEAAAAAGVQRFVNISTDKAADPCSVLGYSKRIAERLTAWFAGRMTGECLSVRFGNVLGSRGSVLTTFEAQIAAGGPVTVTDPAVTRYFMTVQEAVRLVIQAGAVGSDGEVLVLDMGEPVNIADVAARLVADSGRPIEITYTGLRPGEKLHEVPLAGGESDRRPVHEQISHAAVPPLPPADVRCLNPALDRDQLVARCREMATVVLGDAETNTPARAGVDRTVELTRETGINLAWPHRRASDPLGHR